MLMDERFLFVFFLSHTQNVGNKLRTYKLFKEVFETEMHLSKNISSRYISVFAKFRCGVASLRI